MKSNRYFKDAVYFCGNPKSKNKNHDELNPKHPITADWMDKYYKNIMLCCNPFVRAVS